jgi:hypothetical protein
MVIERVKRDFMDEIGLIGLTGSFATDDFHEHSDLDLIIVNNTDKGWGISKSFILGDVGYDVYCTTWKSLERKAELACVGVSSLTDLQILYVAKPEYLQRLEALQEKARQKLAAGINKDSIRRADEHLNMAKQSFADLMLTEELGSMLAAAAEIVYSLINGIVSLNNTCIKRGVKRYVEELRTYKYLPLDFEKLYFAIIDARTVEEIQVNTRQLLAATLDLKSTLQEKYLEKPIPTSENLKGWYEESWCNHRNKLINSISLKDKSYAFQAALGAQNYFDEMTKIHGTRKYNLMAHFDSDDLNKVLNAYFQAVDDLEQEYQRVGLKIEKFDNFETLYENFMKKR